MYATTLVSTANSSWNNLDVMKWNVSNPCWNSKLWRFNYMPMALINLSVENMRKCAAGICKNMENKWKAIAKFDEHIYLSLQSNATKTKSSDNYQVDANIRDRRGYNAKLKVTSITLQSRFLFGYTQQIFSQCYVPKYCKDWWHRNMQTLKFLISGICYQFQGITFLE